MKRRIRALALLTLSGWGTMSAVAMLAAVRAVHLWMEPLPWPVLWLPPALVLVATVVLALFRVTVTDSDAARLIDHRLDTKGLVASALEAGPGPLAGHISALADETLHGVEPARLFPWRPRAPVFGALVLAGLCAGLWQIAPVVPPPAPEPEPVAGYGTIRTVDEGLAGLVDRLGPEMLESDREAVIGEIREELDRRENRREDVIRIQETFRNSQTMGDAQRSADSGDSDEWSVRMRQASEEVSGGGAGTGELEDLLRQLQQNLTDEEVKAQVERAIEALKRRDGEAFSEAVRPLATAEVEATLAEDWVRETVLGETETGGSAGEGGGSDDGDTVETDEGPAEVTAGLSDSFDAGALEVLRESARRSGRWSPRDDALVRRYYGSR